MLYFILRDYFVAHLFVQTLTLDAIPMNSHDGNIAHSRTFLIADNKQLEQNSIFSQTQKT